MDSPVAASTHNNATKAMLTDGLAASCVSIGPVGHLESRCFQEAATYAFAIAEIKSALRYRKCTDLATVHEPMYVAQWRD